MNELNKKIEKLWGNATRSKQVHEAVLFVKNSPSGNGSARRCVLPVKFRCESDIQYFVLGRLFIEPPLHLVIQHRQNPGKPHFIRDYIE